MALSLSSPESPASPGFDRTQRLSGSSSKPAPLSNGIKSPDSSQNGFLHHPKGLKQHPSALLEIPTIQAGVPSTSGRSTSRSPKEKHEHTLPTIRTEGPSPTSTFSYSGRGTIKEARSRRRKPWRKLMWVKQNFPDNYTDATFLESLQRNVNFRAYDFWPLVYDSTVIIQHLSTVVIFVCAFIAISKGRVQPAYVAGGSTVLTVIGWLVWDEWNEEEQSLLSKTQQAMHPLDQKDSSEDSGDSPPDRPHGSQTPADAVRVGHEAPKNPNEPRSRGDNKTRSNARSASLSPKTPARAVRQSRFEGLDTATMTSSLPNPSTLQPNAIGQPLARSQTAPASSSSTNSQLRPPSPPPHPTRTNRRLSTLKSALLIYSTLLGLSPILKSLTRKTTNDSIWALSIWLFLANLLCFDYGLSEAEADVIKRGVDGGPQQPQGSMGPAGVGNSFRKKYFTPNRN
ncbi:hypothetical protein ABW20_dc0110254 [Dactylellina cionopaga]|nr:hypothetical protein ABW20_dc0110254 [Dactylellina cionopaga]